MYCWWLLGMKLNPKTIQRKNQINSNLAICSVPKMKGARVIQSWHIRCMTKTRPAVTPLVILEQIKKKLGIYALTSKQRGTKFKWYCQLWYYSFHFVIRFCSYLHFFHFKNSGKVDNKIKWNNNFFARKKMCIQVTLHWNEDCEIIYVLCTQCFWYLC